MFELTTGLVIYPLVSGLSPNQGHSPNDSRSHPARHSHRLTSGGKAVTKPSHEASTT